MERRPGELIGRANGGKVSAEGPVPGSRDLIILAERLERLEQQFGDACDTKVLLQTSLHPYVTCVQETLGGSAETIFAQAKMCRSLHVMQVLEKQLLFSYKNSKSLLGFLEKNFDNIKAQDVSTKLNLLNALAADMKENQIMETIYTGLIQKQKDTLNRAKLAIGQRNQAQSAQQSVLHSSGSDMEYDIEATEQAPEPLSRSVASPPSSAFSNMKQFSALNEIVEDNDDFFQTDDDSDSDVYGESSNTKAAEALSPDSSELHDSLSDDDEGLEFRSPQEADVGSSHPWRRDSMKSPTDDALATIREGSNEEVDVTIHDDSSSDLELEFHPDDVDVNAATPWRPIGGDDSSSDGLHDDSSDEELEFQSPEEADVRNPRPWIKPPTPQNGDNENFERVDDNAEDYNDESDTDVEPISNETPSVSPLPPLEESRGLEENDRNEGDRERKTTVVAVPVPIGGSSQSSAVGSRPQTTTADENPSTTNVGIRQVEKQPPSAEFRKAEPPITRKIRPKTSDESEEMASLEESETLSSSDVSEVHEKAQSLAESLKRRSAGELESDRGANVGGTSLAVNDNDNRGEDFELVGQQTRRSAPYPQGQEPKQHKVENEEKDAPDLNGSDKEQKESDIERQVEKESAVSGEEKAPETGPNQAKAISTLKATSSSKDQSMKPTGPTVSTHEEESSLLTENSTPKTNDGHDDSVSWKGAKPAAGVSSNASVHSERSHSLAEDLRVGSTGGWEVDRGRRFRDTPLPVRSLPRGKNLYSPQSMLNLIEKHDWRPACSPVFPERVNVSRRHLAQRSTASLPSLNKGRRKKGLTDSSSLRSSRTTSSRRVTFDVPTGNTSHRVTSDKHSDKRGRPARSNKHSSRLHNIQIEKQEWVSFREKRTVRQTDSSIGKKKDRSSIFRLPQGQGEEAKQ